MKVITIGRNVENDVVINDPHASRHHLQIIQFDDGSYRLADFGSTNGTYVNGQRVNGEVILNWNDVVRIGNTTLRWHQYFEGAIPQTSRESSENPDAVTDVKNVNPQDKQRHGFVTFWLLFMIVCNIIGIVVNGVLSSQQIYQNLNTICWNLSEYPDAFNLDSKAVTAFHDSAYLHANLILVGSVLSAICSIIFIILIMRWKKVGFWCWAGSALAFGVLNAIIMNLLYKDFVSINIPMEMGLKPIVMLVLVPIGILVLWAILQIKKNGISCWKQLE